MREVYLDNSATTRCSDRAKNAVDLALSSEYGNPSSMHEKGIEAEKLVRDAAKKIAGTLSCSEKEILFTSGATEGNNIAILGTALAAGRRGKHIITTQIEHPSVSECMKFLEGRGFEITYLPVTDEGEVCLDKLEEAVRSDTVLVSIMTVNNEVGSLEPLDKAIKIVKSKNPDAIFHTDAVQAYAKLRFDTKRQDIDLLTASSHKFHGPKGVGFLYIRKGTRIKPVVFGGGQQGGMRSGTINVPGIAGMGEAAAEAYEMLDDTREKLFGLKAYFSQRLEDGMRGVVLNSRTDEASAPHIVNASFLGVRSEVLLHALEEKGIYVSAGSACSAHHGREHDTLEAMGSSRDIRDSALRFSMSKDTTVEDLDYTFDALCELVPKLRKYTRR